MISAAILGLLMMMTAVIVDANPEPNLKLFGIEWKQGAHVIGWVFWVGLFIFLFGGGDTTKNVINKKYEIHVHNDDQKRPNYRSHWDV